MADVIEDLGKMESNMVKELLYFQTASKELAFGIKASEFVGLMLESSTQVNIHKPRCSLRLGLPNIINNENLK